MIFAGAFYTVTLCGQNLLTSQTTWQAPANKNISTGFDGETFTLKTSRYGNFQGFESNAIHLKPGKYVFEADFCTDGQAAASGGAMAEAVGGKAKRAVPLQIQLSNGNWQRFRHVFTWKTFWKKVFQTFQKLLEWVLLIIISACLEVFAPLFPKSGWGQGAMPLVAI